MLLHKTNMLVYLVVENKHENTHILTGTRTEANTRGQAGGCVCVYRSRQIKERKNNNKHTKSNIIKTKTDRCTIYGTAYWRVLICQNRGCDWINCLDYDIRIRIRSCVFTVYSRELCDTYTHYTYKDECCYRCRSSVDNDDDDDVNNNNNKL